MSNANQETIADIVREMRTLGRLDGESTDKIPRSLQALGLRTYADRIEAAATRELRYGLDHDTAISQPHRGARRIAETPEATEPPHCAVRKV